MTPQLIISDVLSTLKTVLPFALMVASLFPVAHLISFFASYSRPEHTKETEDDPFYVDSAPTPDVTASGRRKKQAPVSGPEL